MALASIGDAAGSVWKTLQNREKGSLRVKTGFPTLDRMIGGFYPGQLALLAARPSVGKTAFLLDLAMNVAKRSNDAPVIIFSLEMTTEQLIMRMLTRMTKISMKTLETGEFDSPEDIEDVENAIEDLRSLPIYIEDCPTIEVPTIREKIFGDLFDINGGKPPAFVGIDYITLLRDYPKAEPNVRISNISRDLKALARERQCPFVVLSQLSRACEKRENPRPMLSDLRDSGALEQDADLVMFLFDQARYPQLHSGSLNYREEAVGKTELIIRKQRNGPIGTVLFDFDKSTLTYNDVGEMSD